MKTSTLTPGLSHYLQGTVAATAAAVVLMEILGARMLTPLVGSLAAVWAGQALTLVIALAAGLGLGSWMVNHRQGVDWLFRLILLGACWLVVSVNFRAPLIAAAQSFGIAGGSLLASFSLFFIPLALLIATIPMASRFLTGKNDIAGKSALRVFGWASAGAVFGAFVTGLVMITQARDAVALMSASVVLEAVVAVYMMTWSRPSRKATPAHSMLINMRHA